MKNIPKAYTINRGMAKNIANSNSNIVFPHVYGTPSTRNVIGRNALPVP